MRRSKSDDDAARAAGIATRSPNPKQWAKANDLIPTHPSYARFRPTAESELGRALAAWAEKVSAVVPVRQHLEELRDEFKAAETVRNAVTWASDPAVLIASDPTSWALSKLIALTESELQRRQGWVISTNSDLGASWKRACVILANIATLADEALPSPLSPQERKSRVLLLRADLRQLVGGHADDLVFTEADRKIASPNRFDG